MRRWVLLVVVVVVLACGGSYLDRVTPNAAGAFRRCWPSVQQSYCRGRVDWGIGAEDRCRGNAEWGYVQTKNRARWLVRWGCPVSVIQGG